MKTIESFFACSVSLILILMLISSETLSSKAFSYSSISKYDTAHSDSADLSTVDNGITNAANMFNERGFYKSGGFNFDNNEIVNDFNGNLIYEIPLYNFPLAGDVGINLSLNYNGSAGHQFFLGNLSSYIENPRRYNINSPAWILSLNGIAVQTLNFETHFFTDPGRNIISGDSIKMLMPGYHFDGPLMSAGIGNPNRILLLAGDGSLITLVNKSDDESYVGAYSDESKGSYYKAQASYIEDGFDGYRRRRVVLTRGDGAEYVFNEYKRSFEDFPVGSTVNARRKPMMMMLEQVKDRYGHFLSLHYDTSSVSVGRPLLTQINATGFCKDTIKISLVFQSPLNQVTTIDIRNSSNVNGNYRLNFAQPVTILPYGNNTTKHIAMISLLTNPENQRDTISYENYTRKFNDLPLGIGNIENVDTEFLLKRMKRYSSQTGKKADYLYADDTDNRIVITYSSPLNNKLKSKFYLGYGRDPFYTNMLISRIVSDGVTPKLRNTYAYYFSVDPSGPEDIDSNDIYCTTITSKSLENQTLNQTTDSTAVFRQYRTYPVKSLPNANLEEPDIDGIVRPVLDSTFHAGGIGPFGVESNLFTYEKGIVTNNICSGSFLMLSKLNVRSGVARIWNYSYEHKDGNTNYDSILTSKTTRDPLGNSVKVRFTNFYVTGLIHRRMSNSLSILNNPSNLDTSIYYEVNLPGEEQKLDAGNNVISTMRYGYISSSNDNLGYIGQLSYEAFYGSSLSDSILTGYEYFKNDFSGNQIYTGDFYPFKEGNLKNIIKPEQIYTSYSYCPSVPSEVVQKTGQNPELKYLVKYSDGSVLQTSDDVWDCRFPIRTENYERNGERLLSRKYISYEVDGSPKLLIDESLFASEIKYRPVHRVSSIILPGDFSTGTPTHTIRYEYDDILNNVNIYKYMNTTQNTYSRMKYGFDGFGNIRRRDQFTSLTNSNSMRFEFNYTNKPARNFNALNDSTMMSYDILQRLIKSKNSDLSTSYISYSYQNSLNKYFGETYNGFVERSYFTDEEQNHFEKYYDATGNLLQEIRYASEIPSDAQTVELVTNYRYDSLYRLSRVQTPEGKNIYYYYDKFGRQSRRITPDAGQTDYIYDKNNNLTYTQDANQRNIDPYNYTYRNYDGMNRLTGLGEYFIIPLDSSDNGNQFESSDMEDYLVANVYDTVTIENTIIDVFTPPNGYYDLPNYTKGRLASTAFRTRQSDNWNYKYYRYDERGRVKKMWLMLDGLELKTVNYEYNSQDMVKSLNYNSGADFKRYRYRYDIAGRLQSVDTYEGPENTDDSLYYTGFAGYQYNANSAMEVEDFLTGFTGTSLGYDNRGRIISYYSHNSEFIYNLSYLKNSNVQQLGLNGSYRDNFANTEDLVYKYTYDKSNRLLSATNFAGSSNEYKVENTYDKDGNILTLKRYGDAGKMQDDFAYQYYSGTNKLRKVTGSADQYQYDLNGNVTTDSLNKNTSAVYDHRNLLIEIYHKRGTPPARIDYFATRYYYDESGNRVRKLTYKNNDANAGPVLDWNNTSNPGNSWTLFNDEHYARGVDGKELATYTNNSLDEWYVWGTDMTGKIKGNTKYYFFKDHLGSVRAIIDNNYNLVSAVDYDMWGYLLESRVYNGDSAKHKFTGKERDEENLYGYFGARYYNGRVGKWTSIDPQLSNNPSLTPYNYASDNPIVRIDPDGLDDYYYMKDKTVINRTSSNIDRLFVEHSQGNVIGHGNKEIEGYNFFQANSFETVSLNDWDNIDVSFETGKFVESFQDAIPSTSEKALIMLGVMPAELYIMRESVGGKMDQKLHVLRIEKTLFLFDNILYNRNEAANIVWGAVNAYIGINAAELAQVYANLASMIINKRPDEKWDQAAIRRGWYYYDEDFRTFSK